jgi:spore photoproduct lyase
VWFFSGYDCDSLALDPVSGFAAAFLPFFRARPHAWLELRTKSAQVGVLRASDPLPNCVVAYSFTPQETSRALEHKVPSVDKRLGALGRLQRQGWLIGLRFDPLIFQVGFEAQYQRLFQRIFAVVDPNRLHSVSLGSFRLPRDFFRTVQRLYPEERLFAGPLAERNGVVGYRADLEEELRGFCTDELLRYIPPSIFCPCQDT